MMCRTASAVRHIICSEPCSTGVRMRFLIEHPGNLFL